jgi:hypothetical protein
MVFFWQMFTTWQPKKQKAGKSNKGIFEILKKQFATS